MTLVQRLTKARLAGSVQGDTSAITMNLAKMVLSGKRSSETAERIQELRKSRTAALEQFKMPWRTLRPASNMARTWRNWCNRSKQRMIGCWPLWAPGRGADAAKEFRSAFSLAEALYAKGNEASQFQVTRASEAEQARKETATHYLDIADCRLV